MKQKIVIKVQMTCDKCRSKALAVVAATGGVDKVELAGDDRDQVVVVGDGIDSIKLTTALRKKVGPAHLVQVADANAKKEKGDVAECPWQWQYQPYPLPVAVVCDQGPDYSCSIM